MIGMSRKRMRMRMIHVSVVAFGDRRGGGGGGERTDRGHKYKVLQAWCGGKRNENNARDAVGVSGRRADETRAEKRDTYRS